MDDTGEPTNAQRRGEPFSLLALRLPPSFQRRQVTVPAAGSFEATGEWIGAIVVVEQGVVELIGRHGATLLIPRGGILWFGGVPSRLCNPGPEPAVLSSVRRVAP